MNPLRGGCACGQVRYESTAKPLVQFICHCRDCQRASGSAFSASVFVPRDRVTYLSGQMHHYDVKAESGRELRRQFCSTCGSPISAYWPESPVVEMLTVASLDDQGIFTPTHELWVSRAEAWHPFHPDTIKVPEGPAEEVVRAPIRAYFAARQG
ncbi:GFA family protein [Microbulbifer sediminum]|uniref:GFA family protein n=1 Tax=Microbulbifer sediminum TaxID=2904250 RepID=UPI001F298D95|nr:GFA family protein [Microbulbifer sediminum]